MKGPKLPPSVAISPCPNDTFAFYALLHGKTAWGDPPGVSFADIEELNHLCFDGRVPFCKVSFHAYLLVRDQYRLLQSGSALGKGCGPLLVAREPMDKDKLKHARIAIPGRFTTAALLLRLWLAGEGDFREMVFDDIMPAVVRGEVDAGLIIHESRFTFGQYGLISLIDLGDWWEEATGFPIPLGGIVAHRSQPPAVIESFDQALGQSIDYAWAHREETLPFMRLHAQEMADDVMNAHVNLYVNAYTRRLGEEGHRAVEELASRAVKMGIGL